MAQETGYRNGGPQLSSHSHYGLPGSLGEPNFFQRHGSTESRPPQCTPKHGRASVLASREI